MTSTFVATTGRSYIAGEWVAGHGPEVYGAAAATGERTDFVGAETDLAQIAAAATAAAEAFAAVPLAGGPTAVPTAAFLTAIADHLESQRAELVAVAGLESGLSDVRLNGELTRTTGQLQAFAAAVAAGQYLDAIIDTADPNVTPPRPDSRRIQVPLGPVAVWSASNFPFAFGVIGGDTASAFAAGCPVLLKGHPAHPATGERLARCVADAADEVGMPTGWFSYLLSAAPEIGIALARDPRVRALAFTGSLGGGRALMDAGAARPEPIPVYAEMGSVNPLVITASALAAENPGRAAIATAVATAVAGSSGQLCTKPGLVIVPAGSESFIAELTEQLAGQPTAVLLTDRTRELFDRRVEELTGLDSTQTVLHPEPTDRRRPPVLLRVRAAHALAEPTLVEEAFGPLAVVVETADDAELLDFVAGLPGSLTATLFTAGTGDDPIDRQLLDRMGRFASRLVINGVPTGVPVGWATVHTGPYPASSNPAATSVGMTAASRFLRPLAFQNVPAGLLPAALADADSGGLRRIDGQLRTGPVSSH